MRTRVLPVVILGAAAIIALSVTRADASAILYGPTAYQSFTDSPFSGPGYSMYVEDLEDGVLNTPGVWASGGSVIDGPYVDSVENGGNGHSWYSNFVLQQFTFAFDQAVLGALPTVAGIVLTDVGYNALTPYFGNFYFEAFGLGGVSLGAIGPYYMGDGHDTGQKAEDRFFGVMNAGGISAIRIGTSETRDWEVDHLQYGTVSTVPEPSSLMLLAVGVAGAIGRRYRQRNATR
jgi:PEP-CTERM motif